MTRMGAVDLWIRREPAIAGRPLFVAAALSLAVGAACLAGYAPVGFSIITVFLFAGPHNWIEFRYFLGRLPARWGPLRNYFLFAFAGVFGLTAAFAALPWVAETANWGEEGWLTGLALWNSILLAWITALVLWRSRQRPRRDWSWMLPVAFALLAANWLMPLAWDLGLVYLHPLVALWILDREIRRSRPEWRRAYHACLACVPLLVVLLWWRLASSPPLPGDDALTLRIANHAGANILQGVSSHLLVSTHTFLEMLHYGVWLLAIPVVGLRSAPWRLGGVPLTWGSPLWRPVLGWALAGAAVVVLLLWACFLANYPLTRDVYFTVAMLHVLAEVPFLLRAL